MMFFLLYGIAFYPLNGISDFISQLCLIQSMKIAHILVIMLTISRVVQRDVQPTFCGVTIYFTIKISVMITFDCRWRNITIPRTKLMLVFHHRCKADGNIHYHRGFLVQPLDTLGHLLPVAADGHPHGPADNVQARQQVCLAIDTIHGQALVFQFQPRYLLPQPQDFLDVCPHHVGGAGGNVGCVCLRVS